MDLEELAMRMAAMEERNASMDAASAQNMFMDKYGTKFSNDGDLGVAILGELNRRGVDVSAADDAVQQILDQLRAEATQLLDKIKIDQAAVAQSMEKINQIDEAVQAAAGKIASPQEPPPIDPATGGMPPADMGAGAPPSDGAMPPADMGAGAPPPDGAMPPADMGAGAPPSDGAMPPADMGAGAPPPDGAMPPAPPMPPPGVLSDARLKTLKARVSAARQPKASVTPPKPTWKPSSGLLAAVGGGM